MPKRKARIPFNRGALALAKELFVKGVPISSENWITLEKALGHPLDEHCREDLQSFAQTIHFNRHNERTAMSPKGLLNRLDDIASRIKELRDEIGFDCKDNPMTFRQIERRYFSGGLSLEPGERREALVMVRRAMDAFIAVSVAVRASDCPEAPPSDAVIRIGRELRNRFRRRGLPISIRQDFSTSKYDPLSPEAHSPFTNFYYEFVHIIGCGPIQRTTLASGLSKPAASRKPTKIRVTKQ